MTEPTDGRPLLSLLMAHQRRGWRRGDHATVETYLERQPELNSDPDTILDLIYNEIVLRAEVGETPRLEEYLRRFPHLAEPLRLQFELEGALCPEPLPQSDGGATAQSGFPPPSSAVRPDIPGYEILGELGRGGMGVVYKARQVRLNRVVALKMILAGDYASPEAAVRFLGEAESVARLHHPHIVQVHAFGDCEGRPYFEMEYVAGGSLADRLDGTPWPAREAARLIETLARAIHEVHRLAIVHRDLKPANILMTADGKPKVADFGLAKWLDVESGLTRTDHVLGSPSYMAPEQTEGRAFPVGAASDVYSLGVILYELLTGRPPFKAATVLETLEQVKSAEPVSPARLRPGLPRDLETICLKCLRKEPARRYPGADHLAEDLRRFGAGESILARPVGAAERTWRWCQREPALAALAAALVAGFLGVATQWWRAERHLRREVAAGRALQDARRRSQERFQLGMGAVDGYSALAGKEELLKDPRLAGLRKRLLGRALEFYKGLQASLEADPAPQARSQLAAAYNRVGSIQTEIGSKAEALASHRRALTLWEALADDDPANPDTRSGAARSHTYVGILLRATRRPDEALRSYENGLAIAQSLARDHPTIARYKGELAWCLSNIGTVQAESGRADEAIRSQESALAIREGLVRDDPADPQLQRDLAWCQNDLGIAHEAAGRPAEALTSHRQALALWEALAGDDPTNPDTRSNIARSHTFVGILSRAAGHPDEAMPSFERALAIEQALAREHPAVARYKEELAWCLNNIGAIQAGSGRADESIRSQESALAIREALARDDTADFEHLSGLARYQRDLGMAHEAAGHPAEALRWVGRALTTLEELAQAYPTDDEIQYRLASCLGDLGLLQRRARDPEATRSFERLVAIRESLTHSHPTSASHQVSLASSYIYRAIVRAAAGLSDTALVDIGKAEQIAERSPDVSPNVHYNLACAYAQCSNGGLQRAEDVTSAERAKRQTCADRAMAELRRAVAAGFVDVPLIRRDVDLDPLRPRRDFQELLMDLSFLSDPFQP
jgi:eukaryotic-like serine/threonine-protein kinase